MSPSTTRSEQRTLFTGLPATRTPGDAHPPGTWENASRALVAKALAEFAFEDLLRPAPEPAQGPGVWRLDLPGEVAYRFHAVRGAYDAWHVDPDHVLRLWSGGVDDTVDILQFLVDTHTTLGLTGDTTGHLVRELTATLAADARIGATARPAAELADLGYAELEGHQTGHPWIVPNKGRLGFSARDAAAYPPEARRAMRLPWIAVHQDLADYRAVDGLPRERLYADELDPATRDRFRERLLARGADPETFLWLPVHPWQWDETVATLFAPDIAAGRITPLGEAPDRYLPQQSVRTFLDVDHPLRRSVKLPLSVLNTLVWRGLPTERTLAAPAVTTWMRTLLADDPFLRDECRFVMLGEVASVTVRHPVLDELPGVPYQYRELLGAIWREPIAAHLDAGEHPRTLAALLHIGSDGRAFVAELAARSGLAPQTWLARLFHAVVPPLLHVLHRYGVVFSPHGENTIVVFDENCVPVRAAVKDFVDDVNISAEPLPELEGVPAAVADVLPRQRPQALCHFIHFGLFAGHFRYLAELARVHLGVPHERFWGLLRAEVDAHHARFPELADRQALFDMRAPRIDRLCLNRNRLLLDGYRDRPERPHAVVHGTVPNPLSHAEHANDNFG